MAKKIGYSVSLYANSLTDLDSDNSYEFATDIFADATVSQNLNYITNLTLSNIEFSKQNQEEEFNKLRNQINLFLIQYIVDGFSANVDTITLKNQRILKKIYYEGKWNIIYKNTIYKSFDDKEDQIVAISTKKFVKGYEYDKFINNDYIVVRKAPIIRTQELYNLVQLKKQVIDVLNIAIQKNAIPTLIMRTDNIDETTEQDILNFLSGYKNASASVINSEFIKELDVIEAKVNSELIFKTIQLINNEISSLLGCSNSIFEAKGTELATSRTIDKVVLRNINSHRIMMEGVINEISEINNIDLEVKLPLINVDEYKM